MQFVLFLGGDIVSAHIGDAPEGIPGDHRV